MCKMDSNCADRITSDSHVQELKNPTKLSLDRDFDFRYAEHGQNMPTILSSKREELELKAT